MASRTLTTTTYNKTTIASLYGVSLKTFNAWLDDEDFLKKFGKYKGKALTPKQHQAIVEELGAYNGCQLCVAL